jgi:hypothetical protein
VFGPNGDIKPLALTVVKDHCAVTITPGSTATADTTADTATPEPAADTATDASTTEAAAVPPAAAPLQLQLEGGKGAVYHNGRALAEGEKVTLATYDRVALGTCEPFTQASTCSQQQQRQLVAACYQRNLHFSCSIIEQLSMMQMHTMYTRMIA